MKIFFKRDKCLEKAQRIEAYRFFEKVYCPLYVKMYTIEDSLKSKTLKARSEETFELIHNFLNSLKQMTKLLREAKITDPRKVKDIINDIAVVPGDFYLPNVFTLGEDDKS